MRELIGRDNEMNARYFAPFLLAMPEVLHAIGAIDEPDAAPVLLEQDGTRAVTVLHPSGLAPMIPSDTDVSWMQEDGWVDMRGPDGPRTPIWLRGDPRVPLRLEYLPESRTAYVQYNKVGDAPERDDRRFRGAAARVRGLRTRGPRGARPPAEPRWGRHAQPAAGAEPDPLTQAGRARAPVRHHRPEHLLRRPVPGARSRGVHRRRLRRRAHGRKAQLLRRLPSHHAAQQRHHRARVHLLLAADPPARQPALEGPGRRGRAHLARLPGQRGSGDARDPGLEAGALPRGAHARCLRRRATPPARSSSISRTRPTRATPTPIRRSSSMRWATSCCGRGDTRRPSRCFS